MLTNSDVALLEKHFVTIEFFSETVKEIATKRDIQELKNMLAENLAKQESSNQEETVLAYRQGEHSKQLEDHEKRITGVEHKLSTVI